MTESGGTTTQSGIFYQNTIAVRYLGALLDLRVPAGTARITAVRIEAPEHIDDIVVSYADDSSLFVQAKEALEVRGHPWDEFWVAARKQAAGCRSDGDRFLLVIGNVSKPLQILRETLDRAKGKDNAEEWLNALSKDQAKMAQLILKAIGTTQKECFAVVKRTTVEFLTLTDAEAVGPRDWMPKSSVTPMTLLSHLRDCCGGAARIRKTFRAAELSEMLLTRFQVRVFGTRDDGLEKYRLAIATQLDHIVVPGTPLSAREEHLFTWPTVRSIDKGLRTDFDDESHRVDSGVSGEQIDLKIFPSSEQRWIVLESGAGYGKTTILRATARRLVVSSSFIPVVLSASAVASQTSLHDYLCTEYNAGYGLDIDWVALCEQGRAVVLIDGIDELDDATRAGIVEKIGRASARFPAMPIVVCARDASIAEFPPKFKLCRLQRLDRDQMIDMLKRYVQLRDDVEKGAILNHVMAHRELDLLCRVPLFLALFVATIPNKGTIPTSRIELLERYVIHALTPERHKGTRKSKLGKTLLRQGAEGIAMLALRKHQRDLPERMVRVCLAEILGTTEGDDCLDTLVQHGVLCRVGSRVAFSIPTVQEYLGGCVLANSGELHDTDWLLNVYRRPWAQATQFAIEQMDDADTLLRRQIQRNDDLFNTSLRFVARCIVNGASAKSDLKEDVAVRLAKAWTELPWHTSQQIGQLIADGFCNPLHSSVKQKLRSARDLMNRSTVLCNARDHALTLECLHGVLGNSDIRELWDPNWYMAMKPVAASAVEFLLVRARSESRDYSHNVIAEVFYQLRSATIDWSKVVSDTTLPAVVRAAAEFGTSVGVTNSELIDLALSEADGSYMWESFHAAYTSTMWWKEHLRLICHSKPQRHRDGLAAILRREDAANEELLTVLRDLASNPDTHPRRRFQLQLVLGGLGFFDFAEAATDELCAAELDSIRSWCGSAIYFPEGTMLRGIEILSNRNFPPEAQLDIIKSLEHIANWKPSGERRNLAASGPFERRQRPSDVTFATIAWAERMIESVSTISGTQYRELVSVCAQCRSERWLRELVLLVESYLDSHIEIDGDDWSWFITAAHSILENDASLSVARLWEIIEKGKDLPVGSTMETLIEMQGPSCYPELINYYKTGKSYDAKRAIVWYFERNAERQGLKVEIVNGALEITKVE